MDDQEAVVCHGCVGDEYLKNIIKSEGSSAKCFYCKKKRKSITIERLSDLVADVLYTYFKNTSAEDRGDDLGFHVTEILGCDDTELPLIGDVCGELVYCSQYDIMQGGESRFEEFGLYTKRQLRPIEAERKWADFRTGIMHKSRFFNQSGRQFLEWLFGNIDSFRCFNISSLEFENAVREIRTNDHIALFRARQCNSHKEMLEILSSPATQLSAPPNELARAGRMNPEGVPVFYGAFDRETCIAELRPPVHGNIISGQFRLTRDIRVLDFKRLENAYEHAPLSMFDPEYRLKNERRKFLRTLHDRISRPVLPNQESEYLTTQMVAEYLSTLHTPRVDGVIFASAQRKCGLNIVLFAHVVSDQVSDSVNAIPSGQSEKTSGVVYVPKSLIAHKINAVEFSPTFLPIADGEIVWSTEDPECDEDWEM